VTGDEVAIKLEPIRAKSPQLEYEARVYKSLAGGGEYFFIQWVFLLFDGLALRAIIIA
jgi:casein kinase I family protein HRR25